MTTLTKGLLLCLILVAVFFVWFWVVEARRQRDDPAKKNLFDPFLIVVGALTNFFDTLGIGSFATTTPLFKMRNAVKDEDIPGTLNVGHFLPTVAEALIYITIVDVDSVTLTLMILASVVGAWLGAGVVSRLPRRRIQVGMGICLLVAAALMMAKQYGFFPKGGDLLALEGTPLVVGLIVISILGALMTLGIGLFAPCMILVSLLGMSPKAAFPIMMGACAFLMPAASLRFIRTQRYDLPASIGLTLGGVPAVLVAAYIVKELPLDVVRILVVAVVVYTAIMMLTAAGRNPELADDTAGLALPEAAEA